ncbi:MAG: hypothetical protein LBG78_06065 [Azoarcus sp.]|nr:hypothetical protein [Azoarcus sp.]
MALAEKLTDLAAAGQIARPEFREKVTGLTDAWARSSDFKTSIAAAQTVSDINDVAMQLHFAKCGLG